MKCSERSTKQLFTLDIWKNFLDNRAKKSWKGVGQVRNLGVQCTPHERVENAEMESLIENAWERYER